MALQAPSRGRMAVGVGLVLTLALGVLLSPARAEDGGGNALATRVAEHSRLLAEYRQTRNIHGLHEEIWRATTLYREAEDSDVCSSVQARLVRGVGALCRYGDERIRRSAVEALGVMQSEAGAKYLRPLLKPGKEKPADPLTLAAIESAGAVRHESLVAPLIRIVERCPCPLATRRAVETLGGYRGIETRREQIVLALVEAAQAERPKVAPDAGTPGATSGSPRDEDLGRWRALSSSVPIALSRLTGHEAATLDDWVALIDEKRADLGSLFAEAGA